MLPLNRWSHSCFSWGNTEGSECLRSSCHTYSCRLIRLLHTLVVYPVSSWRMSLGLRHLTALSKFTNSHRVVRMRKVGYARRCVHWSWPVSSGAHVEILFRSRFCLPRKVGAFFSKFYSDFFDLCLFIFVEVCHICLRFCRGGAVTIEIMIGVKNFKSTESKTNDVLV